MSALALLEHPSNANANANASDNSVSLPTDIISSRSAALENASDNSRSPPDEPHAEVSTSRSRSLLNASVDGASTSANDVDVELAENPGILTSDGSVSCVPQAPPKSSQRSPIPKGESTNTLDMTGARIILVPNKDGSTSSCSSETERRTDASTSTKESSITLPSGNPQDINLSQTNAPTDFGGENFTEHSKSSSSRSYSAVAASPSKPSRPSCSSRPSCDSRAMVDDVGDDDDDIKKSGMCDERNSHRDWGDSFWGGQPRRSGNFLLMCGKRTLSRASVAGEVGSVLMLLWGQGFFF